MVALAARASRISPSLRECYRFPLSSPEARRDVLTGGLLVMFTLPIGFIMCMGHRLIVLERLHRGHHPAFFGFSPMSATFRRGLSAVVAICCYLLPGVATVVLALTFDGTARATLLPTGALLLVAGLFALPGGMTHNALTGDMSILSRPDQALRIAFDGGIPYVKAWVIGWSAVGVAYASLFLLVVPFFFVSVWAWSVAGYAFTRALAPDADLAVGDGTCAAFGPYHDRDAYS